MAITEIANETWRIASELGGRSLYQYVLRSGDETLLIDTGVAATPREVIAPALRRLQVKEEDLRYIVVTHPDLDHQGGLAAMRDLCPHALRACGFEDQGLVADPEQLIRDRYHAYAANHRMSFGDRDLAWMRANYGAPAAIDLALSHGERLALGDRRLEVLHVPGHSAGHVALYETAENQLFSGDAIQGAMYPDQGGSPALGPTYSEVDDYLTTIDLVESLGLSALHSGHWPTWRDADIARFLGESRAFVDLLDGALVERLAEAATLRELCDVAQRTVGPFAADPTNLMFAVDGHVRRLVAAGLVRRADHRTRPAVYQCVTPEAR